MNPPNPLEGNYITGRILKEFLNDLLAFSKSNTIRTDPGSGLESKVMGNCTALWVRRRQTIYIRLVGSCGDGSYGWVEQDPLPVDPWFRDAVGTSVSGECSGEILNAAYSLNPSDPPFPPNHIVPARRDPVTNRLIILAGN